MLRALIPFAAVLALGAGGAPAAPAGGTPAAFVSVERASQLVGVDLTTGRIIARIRVPAGPQALTSYAARYVLVASPLSGAVTLVDSRSRRVLETWRGFGYPNDVEVEGHFAYVSDERSKQLVVIDLRSRTIVARVTVGHRPKSVAVGDVAFVTHGRTHPQVTIVDVSRPRAPRVSHRLSVPGPAYHISEQPDSPNAYFTNGELGGVGAMDSRGRILWWRRVGACTRGVTFDDYHGRRLWVTDRNTGDVLALSSSRNGRILRRLHGCPGSEDVTTVGTAWVAAACEDADTLAIWDQRTWERRLVHVGDGPVGVAEVVLP